jgi:hypothetical protein
MVAGYFIKKICNFRALDYSYKIFVAFPILILIWKNEFFYPIKGAMWVDPWFYTAGFIDLPWQIKHYGSEYFYSRLSWLIPGAICHNFLNPKSANILLHFTFYCCGYFSFLGTLKELGGKSSTLIGVLIYALNPVILWANGWDYVDGCIITYFLCSLYFMIRGIKTDKKIYFFICGVFQGLLFCANITALILCGMLASIYFISRKKIKSYNLSFCHICLGCISILFLLSVVYSLLGGSGFFMKSSFLFALTNFSSANPSNPVSPFWFISAPWLIVPVSAFLLIIQKAILKKIWCFESDSNYLLTGLFFTYFILFLVFLGFQLKGNLMLSLFYYANYLFPPSAIICSLIIASHCKINLLTASIALVVISYIINTTAICNLNNQVLFALSLIFTLVLFIVDKLNKCLKT